MRIHRERAQSFTLVFFFCHDTTTSVINYLKLPACHVVAWIELRQTTEAIRKYIDPGGQI